MHGLTYDHQYWDWPQQPQKYSYTRKATNVGYATFNIDRLGDGVSDHPADGLELTTQSHAFVLHQVIQNLRAGSIGGTSFATVMTVGHSFGSVTAAYEAATYQDVDGVILSGYMHDPSPGAFSAFTSFYPAFLDPKFMNSGLNATYLTTIPGSRTQLFFNTANADPAVIANDEVLKQTATTGELSSLLDSGPVTPQISAPVLMAVGDTDFLFCDALLGPSCVSSSAILSRESSHFSPQACLEAYVQPVTGHDINLHKNAPVFYETANDWANRRVGKDVNHPPSQPCT